MQGLMEDTQLFDLVRDTIARWRDGEQPDAAALLARHPGLSQHKSLAIDLIYEEFCLRSEAGDTLFRSAFCDRFPGYQQSLVKMLEVHAALEQNTSSGFEALVWPQVGDSFQGYELVDSLGRGSLARVFLARETALGNRLVVVKISQDGAREAQMLGKVAHPAIVPIFSVKHDEETGWTVICMPLLGTATATDLLDAAFAEGRPPSDAGVVARVARQFLPIGARREVTAAADRGLWNGPYSDGVARLGLSLAEGIGAAHEAGIMHRDIKPSNVLLSWSGRPMLLDFNLSTDISLVSQRVGGTLPYMAPELMRGLNATSRSGVERQFDARSDVFSLGAVLYHLLTGQLPARPENADSLPLDAIEPWLACRQQNVPPVRSLNPAVQPELEAIVLKCLAFDPQRRFATAESLAEVLRGYLGPVSQGKRLLRRHRRKALLAAVGLAVAGISGAIYSANRAPFEVRLFEQGLSEYDRGEFSAAAETFGKCLELRPAWPEAHFARGQALRAHKDYRGAHSEFVLLAEQHEAIGHSLAGFCMLEANDPYSAHHHYSIAIEAGAADAVTQANYAHCLRTRKEFSSAIEWLNAAIETDPYLPMAYYQRALCFLPMRGAEPVAAQAVNDARRASQLEPSSAQFHFLAAQALAGSSSADSAEIVDHLKQALEHGYPYEQLRQNQDLLPWLKEVPNSELLPPPMKNSAHKWATPPATPVLHVYEEYALK